MGLRVKFGSVSPLDMLHINWLFIYCCLHGAAFLWSSAVNAGLVVATDAMLSALCSGFAFVSNRKNIDEHITLLDWSQGDSQVSAVYIDRDTWLPRIELQESGAENLVLGLCVDESSVYENVKVKVGLEEERDLLPHCLLLCLTLEGKILMFKVASITGPQQSRQPLPTASSSAQSISVTGPSDIDGVTLRLEEEGAKKSAFNLGLCELDAKKTIALDEAPSSKDQKQSEQNKYTLGTSVFDQTITKEVIAGSNNRKAVVDVNNSKPFGQLGQSPEGESSAAGDIGTAKRNAELVVPLTDRFLDKSLTSSNQGVEEKIRSDVLNSTPTTTTLSTSLGNSGVSNAKSLLSSPAFPKNSFGSAKAPNFSQQSITSSGVSGVPLSITSSQTQLQESGKSQNFTGQSVHKMSGNDKKSSLFGQPKSEQNLPKQFSNTSACGPFVSPPSLSAHSSEVFIHRNLHLMRELPYPVFPFPSLTIGPHPDG
ncbi:hypothetical protein RDABS01_028906 [Bienertia sinuspersici]